MVFLWVFRRKLKLFYDVRRTFPPLSDGCCSCFNVAAGFHWLYSVFNWIFFKKTAGFDLLKKKRMFRVVADGQMMSSPTAALPTGWRRRHVCAWIRPFTGRGRGPYQSPRWRGEQTGWRCDFLRSEHNVFPASDSLPFDGTIRFFLWNTISGRRDGEHSFMNERL